MTGPVVLVILGGSHDKGRYFRSILHAREGIWLLSEQKTLHPLIIAS